MLIVAIGQHLFNVKKWPNALQGLSK